MTETDYQPLHMKFRVERTDGSSAPGEKHDGCHYFVLDLSHDPHAIVALEAYRDACHVNRPRLGADLTAEIYAARSHQARA